MVRPQERPQIQNQNEPVELEIYIFDSMNNEIILEQEELKYLRITLDLDEQTIILYGENFPYR